MCVDIDVTSQKTNDYNCFAWAAGESDSWWYPSLDDFWPEGVAEIETISAFVEAFQTVDFEICEDEIFEDGFEKIAIYANDYGQPKHAARQINDRLWTSKIGLWEDVQHEYVTNLIIDINGKTIDYGKAVVFMKRIQ